MTRCGFTRLRRLMTGIVSVTLALVFASSAAAQPFSQGLYSGGWQNTTFGSTGDASFLVQLDGSDLTVTVDLNGNVFGGADPDPLVLTGVLDEEGTMLSAAGHPTYGDVSLNVGAGGAISGAATSIPDAFITETGFTGTIDETELNLDYTVSFTQGTPAEGVIQAVIPEPGVAALWAAGVPLMLRRGRGV